ncbi:phosphonopyruvate decarboxylase [Desulfonatronum parangueonense]
MIDPAEFHEALRERGIRFFTGVPDSLLKNLCAYIEANAPSHEHVLTASEGNGVALAAGYHLASGRMGAVYMQNSGLGNCVNPLTSLTDPEVYAIPMLLIIGWRGEPGTPDEPQHVKQGRITPGLLELLEIPYRILEARSNTAEVLGDLLTSSEDWNKPVALLVRKKTFMASQGAAADVGGYALRREEALRGLLNLIDPSDVLLSTTGKTSRELFELRQERGEQQRDFLTVGSMGHASSIALGVALGRPDRRVICLDGDGAMLMHMGALPIIGSLGPTNFVHVLLNNAAHDSVGGQRTVAGEVDVAALATACGYTGYARATCLAELKSEWERISTCKGPMLLEIRVALGSRDNLGRPTATPEQNKRAFMDFVHA